jgi:hypothetical protein
MRPGIKRGKGGEEHGRSMSGGVMLRDGEVEPETGSGIMSRTRRPWVPAK